MQAIRISFDRYTGQTKITIYQTQIGPVNPIEKNENRTVDRFHSLMSPFQP